MVHTTYLQFYGNEIFNFRLCQQITVECATLHHKVSTKLRIGSVTQEYHFHEKKKMYTTTGRAAAAYFEIMARNR